MRGLGRPKHIGVILVSERLIILINEARKQPGVVIVAAGNHVMYGW